MKFVKAKVGPPNIRDPASQFTVQYFDEEGNMTIRSGGTRAWRCNNPGALLPSVSRFLMRSISALMIGTA